MLGHGPSCDWSENPGLSFTATTEAAEFASACKPELRLGYVSHMHTKAAGEASTLNNLLALFNKTVESAW